MRACLRRAAVCAVALGALAGAAASDRPADYAALAPIAASAPDGLQRLALPLRVLQQSRSPGLADLRVFNAKGESLPVALIPPREESATLDAALPLFRWPETRASADGAKPRVRVRVDANGAVVRIEGAAVPRRAAPAQPAREWLLDASVRRRGDRLAAVTLRWDRDATGLTRRATLEGSDDLDTWRTVATGTLVDLPSTTASPGVLRDRLAIDADGRAPRYLRLRLDDGLALRGAQAQWRSAARAPLDEAAVRFERADDDRFGVAWEADLRAPVEPRQIEVALPQPNTVLVVALEQRRDTDSAWRGVGRHTLYRLARNGTEVVSPPLEVSAPAARHWRLRLDHPGSTADATALDATMRWAALGLAFVSRGPAPLQLAVGREDAPRTALPLSTIVPDYRDGAEAELPLASLGPLSPQTPVRPTLLQRLAEAGAQERRRWLLWLVLAGAVGGLAWLARSLLRDLKQ
jgi:hypothetical protein